MEYREGVHLKEARNDALMTISWNAAAYYSGADSNLTRIVFEVAGVFELPDIL